MHLNKREGHDMLARVSGSTGFVAAVRSVVALGRDPHDPDPERGSRRIIAHAKCNLGPLQESLAAVIEGATCPTPTGDILTSRLIPKGRSTVSASELLQATPTHDERTERDEAADWLADELAAGAAPKVDLLARGKKAGHSERTLHRARMALGIESVAVEGADGRQRAWQLPERIDG